MTYALASNWEQAQISWKDSADANWESLVLKEWSGIMSYGHIVATAQAYTDRYDEELVEAIPAFTRIVEAKINNALRTGDQAVRAQIWLQRNQEYYGLPSDWGGARDVEILSDGHRTGGRTLTYLSPEEMNKVSRSPGRSYPRHNYYTVIAGQIQIAPPSDNEVLEIVYYQRLPPLQKDTDANWLTEKNPDAYIFGLCTEISAFAKDAALYESYKNRFAESLIDITMEDQVTRWSGPALRVQIDGLVV